jgi:hypothetical protein
VCEGGANVRRCSAVLAFLAFPLACVPTRSESRPDGGKAPAAIRWNAPREGCDRVLREVCGEESCATFDSAAHFARARREPGCINGAIGTCGPFRYVEKSSGFDGLEAYFDEKGDRVALVESNDTVPTPCVAGVVPTCTKLATEQLCAGLPGK